MDLAKVHEKKMKFTRNTDNNILDCHPSHSLDVEYEQNFKLLQATSVRNCPCKHDISSPEAISSIDQNKSSHSFARDTVHSESGQMIQ